MFLTRYGIREWGLATIAAVVISTIAIYTDWLWLLIPAWLGWMVVAGFFRDPIRRIPANLGTEIMIAPADGTISKIERVDAHEVTDGRPAVIIRIFLSVLNVHVNRAPCDATVLRWIHRPGRYLNAQTEESARVNESNLIFLKRPDDLGGEHFGVRQVSGMIARRIVCPIVEGQKFKRGQRFGMIKFGSTTELILPRPEDVAVHVAQGDKVSGGKTIIAELSPLPKQD